ncbi:disease resistance protein At4g27190-like [Nicotiana sylvestris]|uniref:Disease resistance protein At4g27190-like n=1 Tax=Nicotiana sylvestris TaxID=4096 RepID=A0A1U7WU97_NICSY|nr:PREDICTED: disease resistance protein At4g27190-like [Nicotiana sylvestris]
MEIIFNAVGGFVVEAGKLVCKCIYPNIENTVCFTSNVQSVREEMEKLTKFRDDIKGRVEGAEGEGYKTKPEVLQWVEDVQKLETDWESMQENIAAAKMVAYKCCPNCSLRLEVSTQARIMRDQLSDHKKMGEYFGSSLVVENYQVKKVEFIPGPSIEGQSTATRNLNEILRLLEDEKVCIIGVWGMGGVGKTTLVKNLNNELLKTAASRAKLSFSVVIWVTVPKPPIDIRKVQAQIANRLNLKVDSEESEERIAGIIHQRLKEEKSFLLILDDVWQTIKLDHVGVPKPEDPARSKVILTSRFVDVCRQMKTDTEMKVLTFDEDESWQMFVKNAGDIANLEHIQPVAKEIAKECDGLPLAITVIGASMRGKKRVELWKDALKSLRMSEPHNTDVKDNVYKVIKWSFDSLESQDIDIDIELSLEQRSKHVKKRGGDIQSCFLYCSLYPAVISPDDLIHCWWAEGFLGEHDTYEEAYNRGITMIESLKDVCLLEANEWDVKMHDVVRDVAIWIANSLGDEHNSLIQAGLGLSEISHIKMSASVKRISFVSNKIERLPDSFKKCPETTSLLLQDNHRLVEIPDAFFLAFPALRVLNLSRTDIRALPSSINSLYQLRALILQSCNELKELPPIGNLCNLQLLGCDNTRLHRLPQGMDKLTDLRRLTANYLESIDQGILLKLASMEMINVPGTPLESTCFDELSSLQKLTSLCIRLDSSSVSNRDHTWMSRLKRFQIVVGEVRMSINFNNSPRNIAISECEIFSKGELSGMLQFASNLRLENCRGLRKLIAYNSFNGIKELTVSRCYCDFKPAGGGSGRFDPLPNLEHLCLIWIHNLESLSDISHLLGLRFSKLRSLDIFGCPRLRCLFNVGGAFFVPNQLEHIEIEYCDELVELFVQCGSSQTTLANSEIPRVRKLLLRNGPSLRTLGEPENTWELLEELRLTKCSQIRKLPLSIQTNIKVIRGASEWWNQLEWDSDNFKSNLEHCFRPYC